MESILAFLVAARRCEVRELEQLARGCALVQAVSELVHRLQAERGCSNLHLASGGKRFEAERAACAAASAEAEALVRAWRWRFVQERREARMRRGWAEREPPPRDSSIIMNS